MYAAGIVALLAGGVEGRWPAIEGLLAGTLGALLYRGCKARFLRRRPFVALPDLPVLWSPPQDFSFPSGHALHAFAWATLIALRFEALGPPAFALAALIGHSRVVLAVHDPSDVLAGGLIGTVLALAIAAAV